MSAYDSIKQLLSIQDPHIFIEEISKKVINEKVCLQTNQTRLDFHYHYNSTFRYLTSERDRIHECLQLRANT